MEPQELMSSRSFQNHAAELGLHFLNAFQRLVTSSQSVSAAMTGLVKKMRKDQQKAGYKGKYTP